MPAQDRVYRIEHRDVHDRHRSARSRGPELFAKNMNGHAGSVGRVIESVGVDRNPVRVPHLVRPARLMAAATRVGRQCQTKDQNY